MSSVNENKKVICRDVEGNTYEVQAKELTFRPSVYGIMIKDGKVLLSKQWDGYDFPGGGVDLGETLEEAVIREIKEETGYEARVKDIISIENSFFKLPFKGTFVQSLLIYYLCEVTGGEASTEFFDENEKNYADKPEWVSLDEISNIKFYNSVDSIKIINKAKELETKN